MGRDVRWISALALCAAWLPAQAQPQPLFEEAAALEATLTGPLGRAYRQNPRKTPTEFDGRWRYRNAAGKTVELKVEFRQRGNMRRVACSLPPLRLDFVKSEVEGTLFDGQDMLNEVERFTRTRNRLALPGAGNYV